MSYQKKNFMRSVVAFLDFFKSCSKVPKSGFRAFFDYFRKSELFNIAPFDPFSVVTQRQAIERAERQNDRYCATPALRARSRARPKIARAAPRGTRFAEPTRTHRAQKIVFTDLCPATKGLTKHAHARAILPVISR